MARRPSRCGCQPAMRAGRHIFDPIDLGLITLRSGVMMRSTAAPQPGRAHGALRRYLRGTPRLCACCGQRGTPWLATTAGCAVGTRQHHIGPLQLSFRESRMSGRKFSFEVTTPAPAATLFRLVTDGGNWRPGPSPSPLNRAKTCGDPGARYRGHPQPGDVAGVRAGRDLWSSMSRTVATRLQAGWRETPSRTTRRGGPYTKCVGRKFVSAGVALRLPKRFVGRGR